MLVRLCAVSGFTNSRLARRLGVICQADESPTATFSIRSSSANSMVDWIPALPRIFTIAFGSYAWVRIRLSAACAAVVQATNARAAKLTLRIIAAHLSKHCCWKHRQRGGEGNASGSAHLAARQSRAEA